MNVPEGTELADATIYSDELALRLESAGKLESFTGPLDLILWWEIQLLLLTSKVKKN